MKFQSSSLALFLLTVVGVADAATSSTNTHAKVLVAGEQRQQQMHHNALSQHRHLSESEDEEEESEESSDESGDSAEEEEDNEAQMAYTAYGAAASAAVILSAVGLLEWRRQRQIQTNDDKTESLTTSYQLNGGEGVQMV